MDTDFEGVKLFESGFIRKVKNKDILIFKL